MSKAFIFFIIFFITTGLRAQQGYFISIDADGNQPFSVMLGNKNYSSSPTGHLIIPNLRDSVYQLAVNFPNNAWAEHFFTISLGNRDKGYQLKKNAENGWSLQDWQTMVWIRADRVESSDGGVDFSNSPKSKDAFARMMAAVVNDTAVLFIPVPKPVVAKTDEKKKETTKEDNKPEAFENKRKDSTAITKTEPQNTTADTTVASKNPAISPSTRENKFDRRPGKDSVSANLQDTLTRAVAINVAGRDSLRSHEPSSRRTDSVVVKNPVPAKDSPAVAQKAPQKDAVKKPDIENERQKVAGKIEQVSEKWTNNARELIYTDQSGGQSDTVRIVIELDEKKPADSIATQRSAIGKVDSPAIAGKNEISAKDSAMKAAPQAQVSKEAGKDSVATVRPKKAIINSDCKNFATESDLDKLRIRMLAENNLDDRIVIARKVFRTRCFTTRQIKALTELFVNDKTRYAFFDAAYPFVSDTENFKDLIELLSDSYYIDRFKAMVRM